MPGPPDTDSPAALRARIDELEGALIYISAQAMANQPGAIHVIYANAEAALTKRYDALRSAAQT